MENKLTIMVLCYGDYFNLAERCLMSIINNFNKNQYLLRVGLNQVCDKTKEYVLSLSEVDDIYISNHNIHKPAMWRRMAKDIQTKWCMWFDDDSYVINSDALQSRLDLINSNDNFDMAGHLFFMNGSYLHLKEYIRQQPWYTNKPIPCGVLSNDAGFNIDNSDSRWFFLTGGNWLIKSQILNKFNYPPLLFSSILNHENCNYYDDLLLCEILRQNEYNILDIGEMGIKINDAHRRGLHYEDVVDSSNDSAVFVN